MTENSDQADRECLFTHKDRSGQWQGCWKEKNPITKTIERYAKELDMLASMRQRA